MSMSKAPRYRKAPFGQPGKRGAILSPHRFCVPCLARLGAARRRAEKLFGIHQGTLKRYGFSAMDRRQVARRAQRARFESSRGAPSDTMVLRVQRETFEQESAAAKRHEVFWFKHRECVAWVYRSNAKRQWANRKSDPAFTIKKAMRRRAFRFLRNLIKGTRTSSLLGCTPQQFKAWIESHFQHGMNWGNRGEWEIDHVRPCASFDLTDKAQVAECFHYTNTRPLWRSENRSKSSHWNGVLHGRKRGRHRLA